MAPTRHQRYFVDDKIDLHSAQATGNSCGKKQQKTNKKHCKTTVEIESHNTVKSAVLRRNFIACLSVSTIKGEAQWEHEDVCNFSPLPYIYFFFCSSLEGRNTCLNASLFNSLIQPFSTSLP